MAPTNQTTTIAPTNKSAQQQLLVSVIIPTYNYAQYLGRAIDSVLDQTKSDCEVLVIDDGSTDDTQQVVAAYKDRIGYFYQENKGIYAAAQRGWNESAGRYIIFLDADDRLHPKMLDHVRAAIESKPEVKFIFGRFNWINEAGDVKPGPVLRATDNPIVDFRDYLKGKLPVRTCASTIHRDVLATYLNYWRPGVHGMDIVVTAQTLLMHPCHYIDEVLVDIFDHPNRLRENIDSIRRSGLSLVDAVFDPRILGENNPAMALRKNFTGQVYRELVRAYYRAGCYREARQNFIKAIKACPSTMTDLRFLRRGLVSCFKSLGSGDAGTK
jgi:glycosyltransferase involved in cell wall biosynthesis